MKTRFADLFSRVRFSGVEICRKHWGKLWPGRLGVRKIEVWVWVRSRAVPGGVARSERRLFSRGAPSVYRRAREGSAGREPEQPDASSAGHGGGWMVRPPPFHQALFMCETTIDCTCTYVDTCTIPASKRSEPSNNTTTINT